MALTPSRRQRGIALLMTLLAVVLVSLATLMPLRQQQTAAQRERERELLFVGEQYRRAIASYVAATPGRVPQYPKTLDELLEDQRFPRPQRHLRRLYPDPLTGAFDWTLLREQGAIVGVASRSTRVPFKRHGFAPTLRDFAVAETYADWKFIVPLESVAVAAAAPGAPPDDAAAPSPLLPSLPVPAAPSLPTSPPTDDRRSACLRSFSQASARCLLDTTRPDVCRQQARDAFAACLRGS